MITFWHSLGGYPATVLQEIVEKYNQEHETPVELIAKSPQEYAQAALDALESPPTLRPNLVLVPEYMTGRFKLETQKDNLLVPVTSLLDEENLAEIAELVRRTFGEYSLPMNPACGVFYKNQSALASIHKDPDWTPSTFEELIEVSRELVQRGIVKYGFTCAWPESYLIETVLSQRNLPLVEPGNGASGYGQYRLSQMKEHVLDLWQLVQENLFLPPAPGNYDPTRFPFINGETAFFMQGSGHSSLISTEVEAKGEARFDLGYGALPKLSQAQETKYAFPLGGAAVWVFNRELADVPDPAMIEKMKCGVRHFLNYLAGKEFQEEWHKKTAYVPVRRSLIESLKEFHQANPLHRAVVEQTIEAPIGDYNFGIKMPNYNLARKEIYPLLYDLFQFKGTKEEAAKLIEIRLKEFDDKWSIPNPAEPSSSETGSSSSSSSTT